MAHPDKILLDDLAQDARLLLNRVMSSYSQDTWQASFEVLRLGGRLETRISLRDGDLMSFRLLMVDANGVEIPLFICDDHPTQPPM